MAEPRWMTRITALNPEEPREIIHMVEGTCVHARILEADSLHYEAQVLDPFHVRFGRRIRPFIFDFMGLRFVFDGRATSYLQESLKAGLVDAFNAWQRRKNYEKIFIANRDTLEPIINEAYLETLTISDEMESCMIRLRSLGDALEGELWHERRQLRLRFKNCQIGQKAYQADLKRLQKNGPTTDTSMQILIEIERIHSHAKTLKERIRKSMTEFQHLNGLPLQEAIEFLGLKPIPILAEPMGIRSTAADEPHQ